MRAPRHNAAKYGREWRNREGVPQARQRLVMQAIFKARADLVAAHPDEYRQLIDVHRANLGLPPSTGKRGPKLCAMVPCHDPAVPLSAETTDNRNDAGQPANGDEPCTTDTTR